MVILLGSQGLEFDHVTLADDFLPLLPLLLRAQHHEPAGSTAVDGGVRADAQDRRSGAALMDDEEVQVDQWVDQLLHWTALLGPLLCLYVFFVLAYVLFTCLASFGAGGAHGLRRPHASQAVARR